MKKQSNAKEVTVMETREVSTDVRPWGASEEVEATDLLIPKLLLQQGLSKLVTDGKARMGEIRESISGELRGTADKPVEVICFHMTKTWEIFEKAGKKPEWKESVPVTPANKGWSWEDSDGEMTIIRKMTYNYYCLLVSDLNALPVVVSLSSTSAPTAKKINYWFANLARVNKPSAAKVLKLSSSKQENDQGTYAVWEAEVGRDATAEEVAAARGWYEDIKRRGDAVKVDHSDVAAPAGAPSDDSDIPF